ncbi:MAG TPA: amidase family protein [Pseudoxanthomonas sp.]
MSKQTMALQDALDIGRLDAHDQAALRRSGEVSAAELVEAAILRAQQLDDTLGSISHRAFDLARKHAQEIDAHGDDSRSHAGVPYLVKDSLDYPNMPTHAGSRSRGDALATSAFPFVQRLDDAGLVPIGKSTMPEFGLMPSTEPLRGPVTRNPWSLSHSPGGSSGGAGAAIAAGIVPLAHGSDGAGSIRMPAACCGVVGLKPGRGGVVRVRSRHVLEDLMVGDSLMSRSVRDTAWAFANAHPQKKEPVTGPAARRLRIAVVENNLVGHAPHPQVAAALTRSAELCASLGHRAEVQPWPVDGAAVARALYTLWSHLAADCEDANPAALGSQSLLEPWTLELARWNRQNCGIEELEQAYAQLAHLPAAFNTFHQDFDVILSPVLRAPPPPIGELAPDREFAELMPALFDWMSYTPLQNLAGTPGLSLPLSSTPEGLPVGTQFVADRGQEALLLALAFELEAASPWRDRWPPHSVAGLSSKH